MRVPAVPVLCAFHPQTPRPSSLSLLGRGVLVSAEAEEFAEAASGRLRVRLLDLRCFLGRSLCWTFGGLDRRRGRELLGGRFCLRVHRCCVLRSRRRRRGSFVGYRVGVTDSGASGAGAAACGAAVSDSGTEVASVTGSGASAGARSHRWSWTNRRGPPRRGS